MDKSHGTKFGFSDALESFFEKSKCVRTIIASRQLKKEVKGAISRADKIHYNPAVLRLKRKIVIKDKLNMTKDVLYGRINEKIIEIFDDEIEEDGSILLTGN